MRKFIFISALLLAVTACKPKYFSSVPTIIESEKIVEKLIPLQLPADSATLLALFECDSTNRVILTALNEEKSKRVHAEIKFTSGVVGKLDYKSRTVHDTVYVPQINYTAVKEVPVIVPEVKEVNKIFWWQKALMSCGVAFLTLLGMAIYKQFK